MKAIRLTSSGRLSSFLITSDHIQLLRELRVRALQLSES
jgi:hypothetical protein